MVLPQLAHAEDEQQWSFQAILDQLARVYDNPNKVQEAEDKLFDLRQGSDSTPSYIAKFERLLYEAKGQNWPDSNKISTFRNGLSSTVRNRLTQQLALPREYSKFIRVVQKLAGSARPAPSFAASGPPSFSSQNRSVPHNDTMDLSVIQPHKQTTRHYLAQDNSEINTIDLNTFDQQSSLPADTPYTIMRRSPKSKVWSSYRTSGACLRCGGFNHWLSDCPKPARPSPQSNTQSASRSGKKVMITDLY